MDPVCRIDHSREPTGDLEGETANGCRCDEIWTFSMATAASKPAFGIFYAVNIVIHHLLPVPYHMQVTADNPLPLANAISPLLCKQEHNIPSSLP
jgi:hypothetical protein